MKCPFHISQASLQGWGLLRQFPLFRYFSHFPSLSKQKLALEYRIYIWQVLPQLSCCDTCQIWMWLKESNRYFYKIENFTYGEINEWNLSNPTPGVVPVMAWGWDNCTAKLVGPTLVVPSDKVMAQGWDNSTAKLVGPTLVVPTDKVLAQGWDNSTEKSWLVQRW